MYWEKAMYAQKAVKARSSLPRLWKWATPAREPKESGTSRVQVTMRMSRPIEATNDPAKK